MHVKNDSLDSPSIPAVASGLRSITKLVSSFFKQHTIFEILITPDYGFRVFNSWRKFGLAKSSTCLICCNMVPLEPSGSGLAPKYILKLQILIQEAHICIYVKWGLLARDKYLGAETSIIGKASHPITLGILVWPEITCQNLRNDLLAKLQDFARINLVNILGV